MNLIGLNNKKPNKILHFNGKKNGGNYHQPLNHMMNRLRFCDQFELADEHPIEG
jgi:hypothetical protein